MLGAALIFVGVALLGVLTAFFSQWFTGPQRDQYEHELRAIREELAAMRALMARS